MFGFILIGIVILVVAVWSLINYTKITLIFFSILILFLVSLYVINEKKIKEVKLIKNKNQIDIEIQTVNLKVVIYTAGCNIVIDGGAFWGPTRRLKVTKEMMKSGLPFESKGSATADFGKIKYSTKSISEDKFKLEVNGYEFEISDEAIVTYKGNILNSNGFRVVDLRDIHKTP